MRPVQIGTVQGAIHFFDTVLVPLVHAIREMDILLSSRPVITSDPRYEIRRSTSYFESTRHALALYTDTELAPNVCIMKVHKLPSMLWSYNSARPYRCEMSTKRSFFKNGFGVMDGLNSTVTLEGGSKTRVQVHDGVPTVHIDSVQVKSILDIRARPEELDFELLFEMEDIFIFPFILSSMWSQTFDDLEGSFYCYPDYLHVPELALSHLRKMIQYEKEQQGLFSGDK